MEPDVNRLDDKYAVIYLDDRHMDWIKKLIRDKLIEICYGSNKIRLAPDRYTYHKACQHLADQLASRQNIHKYAVVAEIIMHLIAPKMLSFPAKSLSVILSLQDQNIKHGFDLNFYNEAENRIWYGEVKSGYNQERKTLIARARDDLRAYFDNLGSTGKESTEYRWEAAVNEAAVMFNDNDFNSIINLYTTDEEDIKNKNNKKRNALIMVVNFGLCDHPENHADIENHINIITKRHYFDKCTILSILKQQFEDIILFLTQEGETK